LIYNSEDASVKQIAMNVNTAVKRIPYATPVYEIQRGQTFLIRNKNKIPLQILGRHNLQNLMGAFEICKLLGISDEKCVEAAKDFQGAARRLELISANHDASVFRDFAHAPSKVKATVRSMKEQFPDRKLVACFELHTYSSLNKNFISEYYNTMKEADVKVVFYDAHTFELKRLEPLEPGTVRENFGDKHIHIFTDKTELKKFLESRKWRKTNLLMMSSGNFGGLDLNEIATFVTSHN